MLVALDAHVHRGAATIHRFTEVTKLEKGDSDCGKWSLSMATRCDGSSKEQRLTADVVWLATGRYEITSVRS